MMRVHTGLVIAVQLLLTNIVAGHSGEHAQIPISSDASWAERHMAGQFCQAIGEPFPALSLIPG